MFGGYGLLDALVWAMFALGFFTGGAFRDVTPLRLPRHLALTSVVDTMSNHKYLIWIPEIVSIHW